MTDHEAIDYIVREAGHRDMKMTRSIKGDARCSVARKFVNKLVL